MRTGTKLTWAAGLLSLSVAVTACGGTKANTPTAAAGPKVMTIGMWSSPDSFHAITSRDSYGQFLVQLLYPRLVVMNEKQEYEPSLAESWDVSPDQTQYTFKIRSGAKWTDGKPMTADDVAYTFDVIAHPDTPTTRRGQIDTIKGTDKNGVSETKDLNLSGIKVLDGNKIQFTTKAPVAKESFLEKVASSIYIMPKHVLTTVSDLKKLDKAEQASKPTVFGGPFKLVDYKTDAYAEFAPNPDFFMGKPKLDKLFVKIVSQASLAAGLEKGEIDVTAGTGIGEVPLAEWERVSTLPNINPVSYNALYAQHLDFNTSLPEFKNPQVRLGFAHAINRQLIVQRLLKGQGDVLNSPITPANKYFAKEVQSELPYNPEKAKALLQAGGWDFNKEVVLLTPTGNVTREQAADMIMANLQEIGIKVKIEKVDFPTRQARSKKGDFQLSLVGQGTGFDPDLATLVGTGGASNDRKYSNPTLDDLLLKAKLTASVDQKRQLYTDAQKLYTQEVPMLPLFSPKVLQAVGKRVLNVKPGVHGMAFNAQLWDVQ